MGGGGGVIGAFLFVLSKAFDCLLHNFLIAKLAVYGFNYTLWFFYKLTSLKDNKEPKLTSLTLLILTYYMVSIPSVPSIETISGFLVLSKIWDFPRLAFKWLKV